MRLIIDILTQVNYINTMFMLFCKRIDHKTDVHTQSYGLLLDILKGKGIERTKSDIVLNGNGKPIFKGGFPCFNISHSKNFIAVGISDTEIGVDIEEYRDALKRVAQKICAQPELDAIPQDEKDDYLLKKWVMSEAYAKYTSMGIARILKTPLSPEKICETVYEIEGVFLHLAQNEEFTVCAASKKPFPPNCTTL